jgi:hypothetical protein
MQIQFQSMQGWPSVVREAVMASESGSASEAQEGLVGNC